MLLDFSDQMGTGGSTWLWAVGQSSRVIHERLNSSGIPSSQHTDYVRLLAEFEDTISADQDDIGFTDVTQHNIELPKGMHDPALLCYPLSVYIAFSSMRALYTNTAFPHSDKITHTIKISLSKPEYLLVNIQHGVVNS